MRLILIKKMQQGSILVSGLILLLVITLLALYGISNSLVQERNASNIADKKMALEAGEKALRIGESYVYKNISLTSSFSSSCSGGLCLPSTTATPIWNSVDWTNSANYINVSSVISMTDYTTVNFNGLYSSPKMIIEKLDNVGALPGQSANIGVAQNQGIAYRITVLAYGARAGTQVMLQSFYIKI